DRKKGIKAACSAKNNSINGFFQFMQAGRRLAAQNIIFAPLKLLVRMRPLQMVDTYTQYQKIKSEVNAAVIAVMESGQFIGGKVVADFSANLAAYHRAKHAIPCANG